MPLRDVHQLYTLLTKMVPAEPCQSLELMGTHRGDQARA